MVQAQGWKGFRGTNDGLINFTHRDRTRASTLFSSFEHVKSLLIMGPNNTKNSSLKCEFLIINYE
jgi:hypothetical protein